VSPAVDRRVFVAGASGAIGRVLCRLLVAEGWVVAGTTRSADKVAALRALGVAPVVVDVFDDDALRLAVGRFEPKVVVHQLTDLPPALDASRMAEARVRNARLREVGTRHLVAAAVAAGSVRLVAQSIAFAYAPGPLPYEEGAPLNVDASDESAALSARAVASLEQQVLAAPLQGLVLRYGKLYGPGTGFDAPARGGPLHVDDAADAARRAITRGAPGLYNIAEDDGTISSRKAAAEIGWRPGFRLAGA
jgi:nucleoside-diphosphate-sugar epimerase